MSIYTAGDRSDVALTRTMLIDNTETLVNGERALRVLNWQYVVYPNGSSGCGGFEPVSMVPCEGVLSGSLQAADTVAPTTIEFIREEQMATTVFTGGDVGWPRG